MYTTSSRYRYHCSFNSVDAVQKESLSDNISSFFARSKLCYFFFLNHHPDVMKRISFVKKHKNKPLRHTAKRVAVFYNVLL